MVRLQSLRPPKAPTVRSVRVLVKPAVNASGLTNARDSIPVITESSDFVGRNHFLVREQPIAQVRETDRFP